jgi:ELWxxDGT repeat protein
MQNKISAYLWLFSVSLILLSAPIERLYAQMPILVKDINPNSADGFPNNGEYGKAIGNIYYFSADDGIHGAELWRTDGTDQGTYMVKDIQPGAVGSAPIRFNSIQGKLLFFADDGIHGDELWISDGTEAGTNLVKDINAGAANVIRRNYQPQVYDRLVINDILYFAADDGAGFSQLWRSDGTETGTYFIKKVCPICDANNFLTGWFTALGDVLYFQANDGLWKSDGTPAGTIKIFSIQDDSVPATFKWLTAANGKLYMSGGSDIFSLDLWVSDGTKSGTHMVYDMPNSGNPRQFTALGQKAIFFSDNYLWVTDGTTAGTQQLTTIQSENSTYSHSNLFFWKNAVYFKTLANDHSYFYINKTDGTPAGTVQVAKQKQAFTPYFYYPTYFAASNDHLFFDGVDENSDYATVIRLDSVGNITTYQTNDLSEYLAIAGTQLYFRSKKTQTGKELWTIPLGISSVNTAPDLLEFSLSPTISSNGIFTISNISNNAQFNLEVFDENGVIRYHDLVLTKDLNKIDLSTFENGVYFIRISATDGKTTGIKKAFIIR